MSKENILKKQFKKHGADAQLQMLIEECAELIQAICKVKRSELPIKRNIMENLYEEIADVKIVIAQFELDNVFSENVGRWITKKITRMKEE